MATYLISARAYITTRPGNGLGPSCPSRASSLQHVGRVADPGLGIVGFHVSRIHDTSRPSWRLTSGPLDGAAGVVTGATALLGAAVTVRCGRERAPTS